MNVGSNDDESYIIYKGERFKYTPPAVSTSLNPQPMDTKYYLKYQAIQSDPHESNGGPCGPDYTPLRIKQYYDIKREAENIISKYRHNINHNLLFLTVTLPPKMYKFQSITQFDLTINDLFRILNVYGDKYTGSVELTEVGNVHYHMIIKVGNSQDKINLINAFKRKRTFGFVKVSPDITTPDSLNKSANYICKALNETANIIYNRPNYRPDILFHDDEHMYK